MASIGMAVDQVTEELSVRPSLRAEATALRIPAGAPVLLVERLHLAGELAVEAGEIVIAAERFRLRYRFGVTSLGCGSAEAVSGQPGDVAQIHLLIRELADYERSLVRSPRPRLTWPGRCSARRPRSSRTSPSTTAAWPGSRCGSSTTRPGSAATASTWRICTSPRPCAGLATAGRCWPSWPGSASSAATAGWSGGCWTGIPPRSASTPRWARSPWTSGRYTGWPARRCARWRPGPASSRAGQRSVAGGQQAACGQ